MGEEMRVVGKGDVIRAVGWGVGDVMRVVG